MHVGLRWIGSLLEGSPDHTTSPVLLQVWTQPPHAREPCVLGIFLKAFAFFQHPQPAQSCNRPMADTLAKCSPLNAQRLLPTRPPTHKTRFWGEFKMLSTRPRGGTAVGLSGDPRFKMLSDDRARFKSRPRSSGHWYAYILLCISDAEHAGFGA